MQDIEWTFTEVFILEREAPKGSLLKRETEINGLRVKISHPRVARLCTGCSQKHLIKECKNNDA